METESITTIRQIRGEIREKIRILNIENYKNINYGSENEYSFKLIIKGIEEFLADLSILTKHPSKFIRISTFNERNNIIQHLRNINQHISGNPINLINSFENLKVIIRNYNVREKSEKEIEFEDEIQKTRDRKQDLDQLIKDTANVDDVLNELKEKLDETRKLNDD